MITKQDIITHRERIIAIAHSHDAHDIRIFGSVARGDQREESDLDLIVRFDHGRSLFDHGALLCDLEVFLDVKMDVISEHGMRDQVRYRVELEAVPL